MARLIWSIPRFDADQCRQTIGTATDGLTQLAALEQIGAAVRAAWQIESLEDGGLTDAECDRLLQRFDNYIGALKKNGNPSPISSPAMVLPDVSGFEVIDPMKHSSDSGSTSSGKIFETPDL